MVLLQLRRWKFTHKETLYQTLFDWTRILFTKTKNSLFEPPFEGVRGNIRTSFMTRWKARGRLLIRYNRIFFASSCGWDIISRYWLKSAFFKGVGHFKRTFRRGHRPPTSFGIRKLERLSFHVVWKFQLYILSIRYKARVCQMDRRRDRQNYDPQDRASIAASRGKTWHRL